MQELGAQQEKDGARALRCADCGGLNPPDADWCGQCLRPFAVPSPPAPENADEPPPLTTSADPLFAPLRSSEAEGSLAEDGFDPLFDPLGMGFGTVENPSPVERVAEPVVPAGREAESPTPPEVQRRGAFSIAGGDVTWTCDRCDTDNELSARSCRVCGTAFGDTVGPQPHKTPRDPNTAALISLFYPGAGHGYLGLWSQAIARAAMSTWVLAVALVAALQKGVPGSRALVVLFGVAAFVLWALGAHDAYREAADHPRGVILRPRMFLYLTVGLLFLLFVSLMVAGISAGS